MYPYSIDLHLGGLSIHLYGVLMALGFMAGLANWWAIGRSEKRDFTFCSDLLFWIMVSGIAGARVAYVAANFADFRSSPLSILAIWQGGLVYYGGFLTAGFAVLMYARRHGEKTTALFDFVITSLPLAHAFGRVGCFLNGCCYGKAWRGWLAVAYPAQSAPWHDQVQAGIINRFSLRSAPVHPVQLYESAFNLLLYLLLLRVYRRRRRDGVVTALYLLTYPVARFCLEMFRGDERIRLPRMGFSVAQILSMALFGIGGWLMIRALRQPVRSGGTGTADP